MVVIRLRPQGKKRQKTYRVVVDNKRSKLNGKFIEDLGWLDRHSDNFDLKEERVKHWLSVGAQPSDTVYNLFVTAGIIEGKKRKAHSTRKRGKEEEISEEKAPEQTEGEEKPSKESEEKEEASEETKEQQEDKEEEKPEETEEEESKEEPEEQNEETEESDEEESEDESEEKEE